MMLRPWIVAALSLGTLVAWTGGPGPKKYRLEVKTKLTQDLTALGQGPQTQEFSNIGFVTLTARDSASGQAVTVVFDSLQVGAGSPLTPEQVKSVAGSTWHGYRGPNGRVAELTLVGENVVAQSVEPVLNQLFPPLRAGATAGQSWTDTTDSEGMMGVAARTVTNFAAASDTYEGAKVIKLAGASSTGMSGNVESPQGTVTIEGTGTGNSQWIIGGDGTLLAGSGSSSQSLKVSIAVAPEPIPVAIEVQSSTSLLK